MWQGVPRPMRIKEEFRSLMVTEWTFLSGGQLVFGLIWNWITRCNSVRFVYSGYTGIVCSSRVVNGFVRLTRSKRNVVDTSSIFIVLEKRWSSQPLGGRLGSSQDPEGWSGSLREGLQQEGAVWASKSSRRRTFLNWRSIAWDRQSSRQNSSSCRSCESSLHRYLDFPEDLLGSTSERKAI